MAAGEMAGMDEITGTAVTGTTGATAQRGMNEGVTAMIVVIIDKTIKINKVTVIMEDKIMIEEDRIKRTVKGRIITIRKIKMEIIMTVSLVMAVEIEMVIKDIIKIMIIKMDGDN